MKHPGWKIQVRYPLNDGDWEDFWCPETFHSKKRMESCVRQNLNYSSTFREYRVVEKTNDAAQLAESINALTKQP